MERSVALGLIHALVARSDSVSDAHAAFQRRYPDAPLEMIETATLHVAKDGIDAALEWLAGIELFLRSPSDGLSGVHTSHLLYHLYNWKQFETLLPYGKVRITDHLHDIWASLDENNPDSAKRVVEVDAASDT